MNILDSFRNLVSGLGSARDKTANTTAAQFVAMPVNEIDNLYRGNWLAQRICDLPPEDMVRDWRTWQAPPAFSTAIEAAERTLALEAKVLQCLCWQRRYGGAALIFGMKDKAHGEELDITKVGKDDLVYVLAVPRTVLNAGQVVKDPASPYYGGPETYAMRTDSGEITIHASRVVPFRNKGGDFQDAWGDSVFDAVKSAVIHLGMTLQGSAHAVQDSNVDVVEMPDLATYVSTPEGRLKIIERLTLGQNVKGMFSMMLLGGGETYERKGISLTGFDGLLDRFFQAAAGAAGIPLVRLIGKMAASLGNNGEGELRAYYDDLATIRRRSLVPTLDRIDEIVIRSATGGEKPKEAFYSFPPLMQPTAKEMAEVSKAKADTVKVYADTGLIPDDVLQPAIRAMLAEDSVFPGIEGIWNEFDANGDKSLAAIEEDTDPAEDDNETDETGGAD